NGEENATVADVFGFRFNSHDKAHLSYLASHRPCRHRPERGAKCNPFGSAQQPVWRSEDLNIRNIAVNGQRIRDNAYMLPNGSLNVGRIHPIP
ncbi:hypothetical protein, partial [Brevirhabdus pacifica]|uniref:hypothetical protein n=1 Tax=Brevirhabdus pacifica TaxID=1267768 RepID=UPI001A8F137E